MSIGCAIQFYVRFEDDLSCKWPGSTQNTKESGTKVRDSAEKPNWGPKQPQRVTICAFSTLTGLIDKTWTCRIPIRSARNKISNRVCNREPYGWKSVGTTSCIKHSEPLEVRSFVRRNVIDYSKYGFNSNASYWRRFHLESCSTLNG